MTESASSQTADASSDLRELPPSAKLVAKTLEYEGELTPGQLAEATLLPERTVRSALQQLQDAELVAARTAVMDARRRVYSLESTPE